MGQLQARNIQGVFKVYIDGKDREIKCTWGAIENLERYIIKKPIVSILSDSVNGIRSVSDVIDVIHQGLIANKDTRFNRDVLGEYIIQQGVHNYIDVFDRFLSYGLMGKESIEYDSQPIKKK